MAKGETHTGYRVQCGPCDRATFYTPDQQREYNNKCADARNGELPCGQCGRQRIMRPTQGRQGARKCGPWCTEGYGLKCACECGGRNHGSAYPPGTLFFLH